MGKKFFFLCTAIVLILGLLAVPAFAADTVVKDAAEKVAEPVNVDDVQTNAADPDKFRGGESVNFWGGINLRLYSFLYEGGYEPYNSFLALQAQAGMSVDMGDVFWSLLLSTAKPYNEAYGIGSASYVPFYFLNDFNAYFKHAYAVWRFSDKMFFALGRFDKTIDKEKKFMVGRSPLSFHGDYAFDGIGIFPNLMKDENMLLNAAFVLSYLGNFRKGVYPDLDDTYSPFMLIGFQPQLHMKMAEMVLTAWLGFWAITHPDNLAYNSPSSTTYGKDAIATDKDANLLLLELYGKIAFGAMFAWMHAGYNMGAEEQNAGLILGFNHGAVKKPGDMSCGLNLFYIDKYMWFDKFVDGTMGAGWRGVQLVLNWMFYQNMIFYSVLTFKNQIGGGDYDHLAYFKIGVKVNWKTSGGKLNN
ncbi:MAG: hypothetical protein K8S87_01045 [Planctomycetes bacterium]|nr:hypothetical protein [Planctomycetota bacterium]